MEKTGKVSSFYTNTYVQCKINLKTQKKKTIEMNNNSARSLYQKHIILKSNFFLDKNMS